MNSSSSCQWDAVSLFRGNLKLYRIATVDQEHLHPRLILNLLAQPDERKLDINDTTEKEVALESMQFWRAFPHILNVIWEADPDKGPVQVSNMDVLDAYHCGTLRPYQVGAFTYVIPSADHENCIIICINMVLPIG